VKTEPAAPAISHDSANSRIIISGVQNNIVKTPAVVSDSHRKASKRPEDAPKQSRMPVSTVPFVF